MQEYLTDQITRIAISGAAGRMGQALIDACCNTDKISCSVLLESPDSQYIGLNNNALGISVTCDLSLNLDLFDILVDFTTPIATLHYLSLCAAANKAVVIGTTGFTADQKRLIRNYAEQIPILFAPNMSIGVNICLKLMELTARTLGKQIDVEIIETHHRNKLDAPSGTALEMGVRIANSVGMDLADCAIYDRRVNTRKDHMQIGFSSLRASDIIGEHTAIFFSVGERIEITHRAYNRRNFAYGALRAATWLATRKPGLFNMCDVLETIF